MTIPTAVECDRCGETFEGTVDRAHDLHAEATWHLEQCPGPTRYVEVRGTMYRARCDRHGWSGLRTRHLRLAHLDLRRHERDYRHRLGEPVKVVEA